MRLMRYYLFDQGYGGFGLLLSAGEGRHPSPQDASDADALGWPCLASTEHYSTACAPVEGYEYQVCFYCRRPKIPLNMKLI